ncbi:MULTISPECIES: glycosyltransferase family 4 protein [Croceitalea]|uniref:Glycosyltransferase family 1 protein n=1 Tax=Croceitalea vernalis TaxID=3075599 RepID=A0ABU3BFI7_9FLAO|nr:MULTISPECIES: glycosyltransferase family 1 protein [unclassified Croceitalea]MDT0539133.1 glycosyltransferase family 1 protein [Croceitalea sp. P059]MDT0620927.1 glycosyltransferase family 1 protein [Croceitalea sp. P007]
MKIGIEGQRLFRKKKHGMDMVALELIKNLQNIDQTNEYVIFVKPDEDNTCIPDAPNFKIVELTSKFGYPGWEQWELPKAAFREGCDVLHCTSNTGPIFCKVPLVTTLHDIIYLESISIFKKDGTWYQKLGNMYRRYFVPPVIKKSKKVITVSNYEKNRINKYFGFKDDRLHAIYNGVGEHFKKVTDSRVLSSITTKFNLPEKFFFFLGNTDPKKNTIGALRAFADFNLQYPNQYQLVMLDYDENELQRILGSIGHPELRKQIHLLGYVPNEQLPAIISQCTIFLYPSLRESFGIPILEGMACGVPVITSNTSSMPEVAGEGTALIIDPFKPKEISNAMQTLVEDQMLAKVLSEKGISRAKDFSWKAMAENVLALYEDVYEELNTSMV